MKKVKIFVFNKLILNSVTFIIVSLFLIIFANFAYNFSFIGVTTNGEVIAIILFVIGVLFFILGIWHLLLETQIWILDTTLVVKDRFKSGEDRYPREAIKSIAIRKEIQEIVSDYLMLSFRTKSRPWSLSLIPYDKSFGERILIYSGKKEIVKKLVEDILRYIDWPLEEDKNTL